ncbi:MAG: AAA family ATPase [Candidatus Thiodiazotropha sp. (ex Myrtea spinifera)]|nr:AAA family ATPase [Candidatus Thiodiazotropha sp. (ex Myrtea spinifera)]MCU7829902.1 AAA family ATPase [Candidatus Thiodiazotropha sp. (ex Myrtea sp. 'scaly one' KF741663)]
MASPVGFPHGVDRIKHIETHISHLLLVGDFAYKIKKPIDLGFLDFSSLEKRRICCEEELRLNSRLAPDLYLAVIAIHGTPEEPTLKQEGKVLEYAVKMRRFRQQDLLNVNLPVRDEILSLAKQIATFHLEALPAPKGSDFGTPESVLLPMEENFQLIRSQRHPLLEIERLDALQVWTEEFVAVSTDQLWERRDGGNIRECHGDLHLGNITRFENRLTPFDGIEFNPGLRWIDTLSDLAFLLMDLQHQGMSDLSDLLLNTYLELTGDYPALPLLRFYLLYRAMVRAKVCAIRFRQPDLNREEAAEVLETYRRYLTLAESVIRHPSAVLLITHGVSGSGKSHISGWFAEQLMAIRIRSDVERKRLFPEDMLMQGHGNSQRYSEKATEITYVHLEGMARSMLQANFSVIVDATFLKQQQRQAFFDLAAELQTPFLILDCQASESVLQSRVNQRAESGSDASEADIEILVQQQRQQETLSERERQQRLCIDSEDFPHPGLIATALQRLLR